MHLTRLALFSLALCCAALPWLAHGSEAATPQDKPQARTQDQSAILPLDGSKIFSNYCASCHGAKGISSVIGSPSLVASLIDMGVLDELSLLVHPVVVGKGKRLFDPSPFGPKGLSPLKLVSSTTFSTGVLHNIYGLADAPATDAA